MTKIEWTVNAETQLDEILSFYTRRNGSPRYSKRLKKELWNIIRLIRKNPEAGEQVPGYDNRRRFTIGNFVLAYENDKNIVYIHSIRDGRSHNE
jgi:plasmid stabilization system protein ParE